MFYSGNIIAGIGINYKIGTCLTSFANWISTIGALFLLGRFGRKSIMWTMCFAMALTHIALGIAYYSVDTTLVGGSPAGYACLVLILLYVVEFEFSLGPVPWVYMSEIMQNKAMTIALLINWIFTLFFAVTTQKWVDEWLKGAFFIVLGVICGLGGLFVLILLKETKGLSEAQVQ